MIIYEDDLIQGPITDITCTVKVITRVVTNVTRVVADIACEISDSTRVVKYIRRVLTNIRLDLRAKLHV